jgi:hypothetical protein
MHFQSSLTFAINNKLVRFLIFFQSSYLTFEVNNKLIRLLLACLI